MIKYYLDIPIVDVCIFSPKNLSSTNLSNKEDFPAPESPINNNFNVTGGSAVIDINVYCAIFIEGCMLDYVW